MAGIVWRSNIGNYHTAILKAEKQAKTEMRNFLRREGNQWVSKLYRITSSWQHNVDFKFKTSLRINDQVLGISIFTEDAVFGFLDQGTESRSRKMNPTYVPKTESEYFGNAGPGGRVIAREDMPGIEERHWFGFIERDLDNRIYDETQVILQDFVREANNW